MSGSSTWFRPKTRSGSSLKTARLTVRPITSRSSWNGTGDGGGGWQMHDDVAYPLELSSDLTSVLATAVAGLSPTATKKTINEKALLAVGRLYRAAFTSDPPLATRYRFFTL